MTNHRITHQPRTAETADLDRARTAFDDRAWTEAFTWLASADREGVLEAADLERLATAAFLTGRYDASEDAWVRAHAEFLRLGQPARAARCAFWNASGLFHRGDRARGIAWIARAQRLLDEGPHDCVERGYVLVPAAVQSVIEGDVERAHELLREAADIGTRFGDADLI